MKKKKDGFWRRLFGKHDDEHKNEMPQLLYGPPPIPQPPVFKTDDDEQQELYGPPPIDPDRRDI